MVSEATETWFSSERTREVEGQQTWQRAVFERAYCGGNAPFARVLDRLRANFSVLVYLPGNCMTAAADSVRRDISGTEWRDYGEHVGSGSIADRWNSSPGLVQAMLSWLPGNAAKRTNAIFHNLDLLSDSHGGVFGALEAQTALFSIIEGTRKGVVLGLADRCAGRLPERLEAAFGETLWLDEIPFESFVRLIPREFADGLPQGDLGADGAPPLLGWTWMLCSRLRWTDPIRAVNIMLDAARCVDWPAKLQAVWRATRSIDFEDPPEPAQVAAGGAGRVAPPVAAPAAVADGRPWPMRQLLAAARTLTRGEATIDPREAPRGVLPETLDQLRTCVVQPYQQWLAFAGQPGEGASLLAALEPGVILHGPPGTGKTHLARWLARALGLPVRIVSAAQIKHPDWGVAEKNVGRVFDSARRASPCVLVFDDADELFTNRDTAKGGLASAEIAVVESFLRELEGFEGRPAGVFVVLTTNRYHSLDDAVRSRLSLQILVPYPLTGQQVGELVDVIAGQLWLDVSQASRQAGGATMRDRLVERFLGLVTYGAGAVDPSKLESRRTAETNLFSPRMIQAAMRKLRDPLGTAVAGRYAPTEADLARMEQYLSQLPPPAAKTGGP